MVPDAVLLAANLAFAIVFGVFVVALVVLGVVTMAWAVRRDRLGRADWLARRSGRSPGPAADAPGGVPSSSSNGHKPLKRQRPGWPPR